MDWAEVGQCSPLSRPEQRGPEPLVRVQSAGHGQERDACRLKGRKEARRGLRAVRPLEAN